MITLSAILITLSIAQAFFYSANENATVSSEIIMEPARGLIAKAESEYRIITVTHVGGDIYYIKDYSKVAKWGTTVRRDGESRAMSHFEHYRSVEGAEVVAI